MASSRVWSHRDWKCMRLFILALGVLLLGYALLGKGFAYFHIPVGFPLYVGEIVLMLGGLVFLCRMGKWSEVFRIPAAVVVLVFMALGMAYLAVHVPYWGIVAVRDAAVCYYCTFLILLASMTITRAQLEKFQNIVAVIAPVFLLWAPVAMLITLFFQDLVPLVPGTTVPVLIIKSGDLSTHITAVLIFILVMPKKTWLQRYPVLSGGLCIAAVFAAFSNRAAFLVALLGLTAAFILKPNRRFVHLGVVIVLFIILSFAVDLSIHVDESERVINIRNIAHGFKSIFETNTVDSYYNYVYQGTKAWRLDWWETIVDETIYGPNLFIGHGFGENLALIHGIHNWDTLDQRLRSPHNVHMTVLSRMAVPGAIVWIVLHVTLVVSFLRCMWRARRNGDDLLDGAMVFVLCFWLMVMVNASFDVCLEGPHGAIWFWSVMGFGLALTRMRSGVVAPSASLKPGFDQVICLSPDEVKNPEGPPRLCRTHDPRSQPGSVRPILR